MTSGVVIIDSDRKYALMAFLAVLFVLIITYQETISSIVSVWLHSNTYMHGFLIIPVSIWLIWRNRERLHRTHIEQQTYAILLLLLAVLVWMGGKLVDVQVIMHFAFITMIPLLVWMFFGRHILYEVSFPLIYLYFAVPFGAFIVPYMQDITAGFTVNALRLTGIPVFREGLYIYIPSGSFEVAEACSGVRFLIASIALGVLYGYLTYRSIWRRLLFVLVSIMVPIIANGIRAYGIVIIAHLSDYKLATGVDHIIYGWIFFSIVILIMFWLGSYFRDDNVSEQKTDSYETDSIKNISSRRNQKLLFPFFVILVLIAGPAVGYWQENSKGKISSFDITLPLAEHGWEGPYSTAISWAPHFEGAYRELSGTYKLHDKSILIYLAYYNEQEQGNEMINENNRLYSNNWHKTKDGRVLSMNNMPMREMVISSAEKRILLRQWYFVDGEAVASPILAKLYEARSRLFSRYTGSYVFILGVNEGDDDENNTINSFLVDIWPLIHKELLKVHA